MTPDRLTHIEDLTRRYAKYRPCGAGLGTLWGGIVFQFFAGIVLGWILRQLENSPQSESLWHFIMNRHLLAPATLKAEAIAAPFLTWLGILVAQWWVDRRFGIVEGLPSFENKLQLPRWLLPMFTLFCACWFTAYGFFRAHFLLPDPIHAMTTWSSAGMLGIGALALVWGYSSRDKQTQTVMFLISFPSFVILHPGYVYLEMILLVFASYFVLMGLLSIKGALRFGGFLKVSRELDGLESEAE